MVLNGIMSNNQYDGPMIASMINRVDACLVQLLQRKGYVPKLLSLTKILYILDMPTYLNQFIKRMFFIVTIDK